MRKNFQWALIAAMVLGFVFWASREYLEVRAFSPSVAEELPRKKSHGKKHSHATSKSKASRDSKATATAAAAREAVVTDPTPNLTDLYCQLERLNTPITRSGKLKLWASSYSLDEAGEPGVMVYVQSSDCPQGLYSVVRLGPNARMKDILDCRSAKPEEIYLSGGLQGQVVDIPPSDSRVNLAISGAGYFLIECSGEHYLSRSGEFQIMRDGLIRHGGCRVLTRTGAYLTADDLPLNQNGCSTRQVCPAIVKPNPKQLTYVDRLTYHVSGDALQDLVLDAHVFTDALETLDDPATGPTGPYWQGLPEFHAPASCANP